MTGRTAVVFARLQRDRHRGRGIGIPINIRRAGSGHPHSVVRPPQAKEVTVSTSAGRRWPYLALGSVCLALGYIGLVTPLFPGTVFLLIALWSFQRSSPRLESWMLNHPWFGASLRDWRESKSLTARTKAVAIGGVWLGIGVSLFLVSKPWVQAMLLLTAITLTWYLASRPTKSA